MKNCNLWLYKGLYHSPLMLSKFLCHKLRLLVNKIVFIRGKPLHPLWVRPGVYLRVYHVKLLHSGRIRPYSQT